MSLVTAFTLQATSRSCQGSAACRRRASRFNALAGRDHVDDRVALGLVGTNDLRKDGDLVVLGQHRPQRGGYFPVRYLLADALGRAERTKFLPDFAGLVFLRLKNARLVP